jgi:membrane protease subunit HflK
MRRWLWVPFLLLLAYLATGLYQVRPGEAAVVLRFGRVLPETRGPGLHVGLPWGLDRVIRITVEERRELLVGFVPVDDPRQDRLPVGQVLTGDNHLVNVRLAIYYSVDPDQAAAYVLHLDRLETVLARLAEETLVVALTSERVDAVLLSQSRQLEDRLQQMLAERLQQFHLGIVINSVNLQRVQPPEELREVFDELVRARAQRDIREREARAQRDSEVSQAARQQVRTVTEARGQAAQKIALARTEAAAFLALMQSLPAAGPARGNALLHLYLNDMQTVFSRLKVRTVADPQGKGQMLVPFP